MDDQERVEELPKDFNKEKRPSQSSEDTTESWTFLEERKSAENSPRPPKIAVNSNLLSPTDCYDAEPEMSDGISVISEGDGHNTPPESDAGTSPDATAADDDDDDAAKTKKANRDGYRPLTPPNTPPTDDQDVPTVRDIIDLPLTPKKKEKLDVESYYQDESASHRFIGIYPRHVVFLMVVCGIIGGMIGHLWNLNYGCNCDQKSQQLADMYNKVVAEKWSLEQTVMRCEAEIMKRPQQQKFKYQQQSQQQPKKSRWSGHEETDDYITVEDEPQAAGAASTGTKENAFIPSDQFESMIRDHLRKTDSMQDVRNPPVREKLESEKTVEEQREEQAKDSYFVQAHLNDREMLDKMIENDGHGTRYKRSKEAKEFSGDSKEWKKHNKYKKYDTNNNNKRKGDDDSEEEDDDSHEKVNYSKENKKPYHQEKKEHKQDNSGERKYYKSKEEKYSQQKQGKKYERGGGTGGGGGSGEEEGGGVSRQYKKNQQREGGVGGSGSRGDNSEEDSKEKRYNDRKHQQYKKKEHSSGEWSDKRNRGRDELRQQRQQQQDEQGGEKKNWYLERGSEREINRVETSAATTTS